MENMFSNVEMLIKEQIDNSMKSLSMIEVELVVHKIYDKKIKLEDPFKFAKNVKEVNTSMIQVLEFGMVTKKEKHESINFIIDKSEYLHLEILNLLLEECN